MDSTRFPVLLEVRQSTARIDGRDSQLGHPTDVGLGYYFCGRHPREDRIEWLRPVAATEADERRPRWAPDATVTYVGGSGTVQRVDLRGRPAPFPWAAVEADWRDEDLLLVTRDDEGRQLARAADDSVAPLDLQGRVPRDIDRAGGALTFVDATDGGVWLRGPDGAVRCVDAEGDWPRFSPDGAHLAFARPSAEGIALCVADVATEAPPRVLFCDLPLRHVESVAWTPDGARILLSGGRVSVVEGRLVYVPEIWAFTPDGRTMAVLGDGAVVAVEPYGDLRLTAA